MHKPRKKYEECTHCLPEAFFNRMADPSKARAEGDRAMSMGCGVSLACPVKLGRPADWGLDDPKDQPIERVREIRDEICLRVEVLVRELGA